MRACGIAVLSGIAVAAACGLRAFLPLLILGLASRFGLVQLRGSVEWLSGDLALIALGTATVLEIAADKIPVVDHALDAVATVIRPIAAWLGSFAVLSSWPTPWAQIAAVVLGALALTVHGVKSGVRVGSTVTTGGAGNIVLSVLDDVLSFVLSALAVLGVIAAIVAVLFVIWLRFRRRGPSTGATGLAGPVAPSRAP
jgi:hypothetical protein